MTQVGHHIIGFYLRDGYPLCSETFSGYNRKRWIIYDHEGKYIKTL